MRKWDRLWYCGLWSIPVTCSILFILIINIEIEITLKNVCMLVILPSLVLALYIYATNYGHYLAGQRHFTPLSAFGAAPSQYAKSHKIAAMSPPVDQQLLHAEHCNMVFGKSGRKYVGIDYQGGVCGHCIIVGASGSNKTTSIIIPLMIEIKNSRE